MEVLKNRIYKHFKGDYYLVVDFAINNEDKKKYVIYTGLYEDCPLFIRDYDDFTSEVNHIKYPSVAQKYKFELQEINSFNKEHRK